MDYSVLLLLLYYCSKTPDKVVTPLFIDLTVNVMYQVRKHTTIYMYNVYALIVCLLQLLT